MKKILVILIAVILIAFSTVNVGAAEIQESSGLESELGLEDLYSELSEEAKDSLQRIGVDGFSYTSLQNVSFITVFGEIIRILLEQSAGVFSVSSLIISVMLIYGIFEGVGDSLCRKQMKDVLSVAVALLISCALLIPATEVINDTVSVIGTAANFMLSYIPVMLMVLISCGNSLAGSGYYTSMMLLSQFVAQLNARFIAPMLSVFLGVSVASSIVPELKIKGLLSAFSKSIKWLMSFSFTIFSALLTFKTLIATSVDNVSTRAVRYTMSSFVPVVGSALSEAYKTVEGSVRILKNGVGVFAIFAVAAIFLPVVLKLILWLFSLNLLKSFGEIVNLKVPCELLGSVSSVLGVLLSIILCIAALFIISTALIVTVGGGIY